MDNVNRDRKTINFKIVYAGAPFSGKYTNAKFVHQNLDTSTRGEFTPARSALDQTFHFDFTIKMLSQLKGKNARFHVYLAPGDLAYNATQQLILKQAAGIIFVVDSQLDRVADNLKAWHQLEQNLRHNERNLDEIPLVIQYNKRDLANPTPVEYLEYLFNPNDIPYTSFESSARLGQNVLQTLNALVKEVLAEFVETTAQNIQEAHTIAAS